MKKDEKEKPKSAEIKKKKTKDSVSNEFSSPSDSLAGTESSSSEKPSVIPSAREEWDLSQAQMDDSLLGCLEILVSLLGRPTSATALKAGLPLKTGFLTPDLFVRAAARASLSARLVHKNLAKISKYTLPCVLLLQGDKACLLVKSNLKEKTHDVIFPETGKGVVTLGDEELKSLYTGTCIFVKKMYRYDQRSLDLEIDKPQAWFWGTLYKSWSIYTQVAIAAIIINLFAIAAPIFTMNVYDRVVPNNAIETLWVLSIGIFLIYIFDFVLKMLRVYFVDTAGKKADILLASRLFETIMTIQLSARPLSSGGFANEVREFETLREFFSSATLVAMIDLPFVAIFLMVVYLIGGPIVFVPIVCIPLIVIGTLWLYKPLTAWVQRNFREGAQRHALLVEAINGLETIKSFGAEGRMQRNWESFVAQSAESSKALKFFAALALNYSSFVQQIAYIFVIIVGVYMIAEGQMTMGALIAGSILASRAIAPLTQIVSLLTRFNQSMTALNALDKLVHLPNERPQGKTFLHRPILRGNIEYRDITFCYRGQEDSALKEINLRIGAGERVGFLGRIGSGKSTVEKLLLGLYEPQKGSLLIDGTDIRQIDPADLRKNIGYVPQDIYLFFGTVRENITFGSQDIDENNFLMAAEISGVLDFVRAHPQGFDMMVGEGGSMLSGGQRQAIAIARALVRDPSIFIMDEPTAMMDNLAEARLAARLNYYLKEKTFLLITHRAPLMSLVNRLVVMDSGRCIADGPKDKIIEMLNNSQVRVAQR